MVKKLPPSREVRFSEGVTEGFAESVAMSIYQGSSTELMHGIAAIELTIESRRANAARTLAFTLGQKLKLEGYIVTSDIDDALEDFLESEMESGGS